MERRRDALTGGAAIAALPLAPAAVLTNTPSEIERLYSLWDARLRIWNASVAEDVPLPDEFGYALNDEMDALAAPIAAISATSPADLARKLEVFARPLEGYAEGVRSPEQAELIAAWRDAQRLAG